MARKVCLYGVLSAVCLCLSFVEHLIPIYSAIPGIKLGLANAVALLLILNRDIKGAFAVNTARILLSVLLFASPFSLVYSLTAGIISITVMSLVSKIKKISVVGFSIIGAVVHNLIQIFVANILLGAGVWYYLPFLLLSASMSGFLTGFAAKIIFKRIKSHT